MAASCTMAMEARAAPAHGYVERGGRLTAAAGWNSSDVILRRWEPASTSSSSVTNPPIRRFFAD